MLVTRGHFLQSLWHANLTGLSVGGNKFTIRLADLSLARAAFVELCRYLIYDIFLCWLIDKGEIVVTSNGN
jgi:hypothetical protein